MSSDGYFQMQIWFCAVVDENPCVETISCEVKDQIKLQTYIVTNSVTNRDIDKTHNNRPDFQYPVRSTSCPSGHSKTECACRLSLRPLQGCPTREGPMPGP